MAELKITAANFENEVLNSDKPVLLDFYASIPMLVVFKDGKAVAKSVGYRPKAEIAAMVESAK